MNIYQIAEKAGVSIATVSRVLNNSPSVSEKTRKKVLQIMEKDHYQPNVFARGLTLDSIKQIGVICTDVSGSPPHLMLHSSGALICSYGRREAPFSERAMVSYDGGETWTDEYVLDDRPKMTDLGYPASVELSDGSILTIYYQKVDDDPQCSILYTKWRLK